MQQVSKSRFKARALELFRQVQETGEPLTITDRGRPVLQLVPYVDDPETLLAPFRGRIRRYVDPTEPVGSEDWEALE